MRSKQAGARVPQVPRLHLGLGFLVRALTPLLSIASRRPLPSDGSVIAATLRGFGR